MASAAPVHPLRTQYENWPYPHVPLLARVSSSHPFELHVDWLWDRSGSGKAPNAPRIWIAGCGAFQPYVFAVANPHAQIVATDFSERSLAIAQRRCRLHGKRNVRFVPVDLADPSTWPEGEFDLIECYGVLMNLADPAAALAGLRQRLTANGVLRLMVYPQYSRTRIFQIQRLARLLGLHAGDRAHPAMLRSFLRQLPRQHPLRWAFFDYSDAANDAGVVDAFLHRGDRGFTAYQLADLLQQAELRPAYWFHRPYAQPQAMAEALALRDRSQPFVLNYLDLWQELRGNFVVCCRRSEVPTSHPGPRRVHPSFFGSDHALRHRLTLARLRTVGGALPARTSDGKVVLTPTAARALGQGATTAPDELLLGGRDHACALPAQDCFSREGELLARLRTLHVGARAPNPLYAHLFAAWELDRRFPELRLPSLSRQLTQWLPSAEPLEDQHLPWGLTPHATALRLATNLDEHLAREPLPTVASYAQLRLRNDAGCCNEMRTLLANSDLPCQQRSDAELRELWLLLRSADALFVTLSAT